MEDENSKSEIIERVVLSPEAIAKLDRWIEKITSARQGVDLSKRKLVDWLILSKAENLSPAEEKEVADLYYNDVRFLKYALKEIREAQDRGESVNLAEVLQKIRIKPRSSNKNPVAKSKPENVEASHE
jgi:hypothetical protein